MIAISIDVDWAHDEVVNYLVSILDDYKIKCTIFCTHKINLNSVQGHELAIHPNFTRERTDLETIQEMMTLYPGAKGTRSHRLHFHGGLIEIYNQFGLEYDSNYYMPGQTVQPFTMYKGVVELPLYFSDDAPISDENTPPFEVSDLHKDGLVILNFHPIHVFLNSKNFSDYVGAKKYMQNPEELIKLRNKDRGTKDNLIDILNYIKQNSLTCFTLKEISDEFKKSSQ